MRDRLFVSCRENFLLPSLWMKCVIFPVNASELKKVVELFLEYEFAVRADVVSGIVLYVRFILLFRSPGVKWLRLLRT